MSAQPHSWSFVDTKKKALRFRPPWSVDGVGSRG